MSGANVGQKRRWQLDETNREIHPEWHFWLCVATDDRFSRKSPASGRALTLAPKETPIYVNAFFLPEHRFDRWPRGSTVCGKKRHRSHQPHSPRFSRSWQCSGPTMITCLPRRKAQKRLARHFILVTSAGAGGSAIYLQTKGKIEQAVIGFGFEPVDLICPGFLIGSFNDRPALRRATTGAPQPSSPPLHSLPLSFSG